MQFLAEYGLFLAKAITIVVTILIVVGGIISLAMRQKKSTEKRLEITHLNPRYEEMEKTIAAAALTEVGLKRKMKADQKKEKQAAKAEKKAGKTAKKEAGKADESRKKRLFVLDFDGDIKATDVENMRQEISALLTIADKEDEVLVRLESGGGTVHGYGLAASQLQRIRDQGIPLTIAVDKVAASGGYMMACVANKIIAAPFAIIGSIGVLAQIPNLNRLLKKHDVDFEQLYAGEFKRTLTLFGENTAKGRAKMQAELEETHALFKSFVKSQRPGLDVDKVATGEHWLGTRALELGLVDLLQTSDDYLMSLRNDAELILIEYSEKQTMVEKLSQLMTLKWRQQSKLVQDVDKPLLM
ncbi:protease SohB [Candidatus Spongiihabitans sp.]|uniref:protease SohB n=1 Tax=Candidatus Spongiihabitans sp. TaxID=3101308 RepID=UPI003C7ED350